MKGAAPQRLAPNFTFSVNPVNIRESYFDYMIGGFNNLPLKTIPQSAGGGYFMTFHGRPQATSNRRVFYAYLDNSGILVMSNPISQVDNAEGYPDVAVDPISGKPMYVWHANADADPGLEVLFKADAFLNGIPGLWGDVVTVIDNPISITAPDNSITTDNVFIWPSVVIGPSPYANKRRVYVLGRNSTSHNAGNSGNVYIAHADFSTTDIETGASLIWTYTSVPILNAWAVDAAVTRRPNGSLVTDDAGNIYYVGYHSSSISEAELDVFKCDNFGEGTWTWQTAHSTLSSWNPPSGPGLPGYFTNDGDVPYADSDLNWRIMNSGHLNASIDQSGKIHIPGLWALTAGLDTYFPSLQFLKEAVYDPFTQAFTVSDIYPQKDPADNFNSCYTPWDIEAPWGEVDEWIMDPDNGWYPIFETNWPFPHWDATAHSSAMMFHYNNVKITQANEQGLLAAVWQDSQRGMQDNNSSPDILISASPNNGGLWLEPIVLNNLNNPQLAGMCPMWVYPADKMIYTGIQSGYQTAKLGLMFYDDYTWGANVLTPPYHPNSDGGRVMFMELSIAYQYVGFETVADPVINPWGGTFEEPLFVSLETMTQGAQIRYTLDGSLPSQSSALYESPIAISVNTTINAYATMFEHNPSNYVSAQFLFQVHDPVLSPDGGVFTEATEVTLTCPTPEAQIRYTMDGSEPDLESPLYNQAIILSLDSSVTIKARAFRDGWNQSATVSEAYVVTGSLAMPVISPASGVFYAPAIVSMVTASESAEIRYTLDGSEPNETSLLYIAPFTISESTTVKSKAVRPDWVSSQVAETVYEFPDYVTGLRKTYPNPFSGTLNIEMGIKEIGQSYQLKIYNIKGACVFTHEGLDQGVFRYQWNGRDQNQRRLAAGIYFLRFTSGALVQTTKIMLMGDARK